ncbi:hypothetical protein [Mycolicibacterium fortuitum]|nr:hypothetical protein [Mycolicibacterium fortuitum]MDV7302488.1 hypothetical protein [Mycolicibacterium fortuitum]MDV7309678.1 hypothetical protein [Mycolicibacterium fortuitum]
MRFVDIVSDCLLGMLHQFGYLLIPFHHLDEVVLLCGELVGVFSGLIAGSSGSPTQPAPTVERLGTFALPWIQRPKRQLLNGLRC